MIRILLLFAVVIAGMIYGAVRLDAMSCDDVAQQTGHETRYSWKSSCYIRVGDEWMPLDRYNNVRIVTP